MLEQEESRLQRTTYEVDPAIGFVQRVHASTGASSGAMGGTGVSQVCLACVPSAEAAGGIVGADSSRGFELLSTDGDGVLRCSLVACYLSCHHPTIR